MYVLEVKSDGTQDVLVRPSVLDDGKNRIRERLCVWALPMGLVAPDPRCSDVCRTFEKPRSQRGCKLFLR